MRPLPHCKAFLSIPCGLGVRGQAAGAMSEQTWGGPGQGEGEGGTFLTSGASDLFA